MKAIALIVSGFLFGQIAIAETLKVNPKEYACADLQELLQREEKLEIYVGISDWTVTYHSLWESCETMKTYSNAAYIRAVDKTFCRVGFVCQKRN